jgi:capsular polysaccharide biosynthesis protein
VTISGHSGALIFRGRILVDSLQHVKVCTRSSSYRTVRWTRRRKLRGAYTSIFYLPEAGNLYHWVCDCLPRLYALQQVNPADLTLICQAGMNEYQRTTLAAVLGDWRVQICEIKPTEEWELETYHFASFAAGLSSGVMQPEALQFVRERLLRLAAGRNASAARRIYVSRAAARERVVLNEAAVIDCLERFGFVTVRAEDLSAAQQVALFRDARVIVGAHGAGLTNLLWAENTVVLELHPRGFYRPHFCLLAKAVQARHVPVEGGNGDELDRFTVDVATLEQALRQVLPDSGPTTASTSPAADYALG